MSAPLLRVEDLQIFYAGERAVVRAVDGVSLELARGEALALVGESGSGKTTLGRGLMGLLPEGAAVRGLIELDGEDVTDAAGERLRRLRGSEVGMIFQEPMTRLDPLMRVSDHFAETLRAHLPGIDKEEIRVRTLRALAGVGIPPTRVRHYPHEFSGGMRQRIMLALALALEPRVVVADEPTTALDVLVEAQILAIMRRLRDAGTALILITHNLGIVAEVCPRVAVMYAGRIVESGPTAEVFRDPRHPYTQALLEATISLETEELIHLPGDAADLSAPPPGCRFHPRCPHRFEPCDQTLPPAFEVGPGHRAACWLQDPEVAAGRPAGARGEA